MRLAFTPPSVYHLSDPCCVSRQKVREGPVPAEVAVRDEVQPTSDHGCDPGPGALPVWHEFGLPIETLAAILVAAAADHVRADWNGTCYLLNRRAAEINYNSLICEQG